MREVDLQQHIDSYKEHWQKAVKALGDPARCQDINGWVGDLRRFAMQIFDDCMKIMGSGGIVTLDSDTNVRLSIHDVEHRLGKRMEDILKLDTENREIARKAGVKLA